MDFVAFLVLKNLGHLSPEDDELLDKENFKFVLYMSFQDKQSSIG